MYVKDLSKLGRKLEDIILLDNSPNSYYYQPENGLPISNWYDDTADRELFNYYEILEALAFVSDVRDHLPKLKYDEQYDYSQATHVINKIYSSAKPKPTQKSILTSFYIIEQEDGMYRSGQNFNSSEETKTAKRSIRDFKNALITATPSQNSQKDYKVYTTAYERSPIQTNKSKNLVISSCYFSSVSTDK
jgi:hypothetical protein